MPCRPIAHGVRFLKRTDRDACGKPRLELDAIGCGPIVVVRLSVSPSPLAAIEVDSPHPHCH